VTGTCIVKRPSVVRGSTKWKRNGGKGERLVSWEKSMNLTRKVRMVSIVRVIWTYLLGGKEVTKKN